MPLPKVVIVGRPNVGKSSLFNWLAGRRIAIVDDMAGVTRDRVGALAQLGDEENPRFFELIDTGGIGMVDRDDLSEDVERQIETAMNEADLILFVVDVREGLMPLDEEVAQRLRYVNKPVILVMNKADTPEIDDRGGEFYKLGRGKPVSVSTQQNRNKNGLLKLIEEMLPAGDDLKPADAVMKIAVVGRPNTGKSTFINTLAHAERMIVSERPGTTRDSVDVRFELDGLPFLAIDTAGRPAQGQDPRRPRLLLDPPRRALDPPGRRRPAVPRPDPGDLAARQAAGRLHRQAVQALHLRGQQVGPDRHRPDHGELGDDGQVRPHGPARLPDDGLHAAGLHHRQDRQERQGAAEPVPVDVQAGASAGSAPARSTASSARPSRPIRPPPREPAAADLLRHPGRHGPADDRPVRQQPRSSTRPISATCSTSSARSCRSTTSRSSSTSAPDPDRPVGAPQSDPTADAGPRLARHAQASRERIESDTGTRSQLDREVNDLLEDDDCEARRPETSPADPRRDGTGWWRSPAASPMIPLRACDESRDRSDRGETTTMTHTTRRGFLARAALARPPASCALPPAAGPSSRSAGRGPAT